MEFKKVEHPNGVREYFTTKTKMIISMILTIVLVIIAFLNAKLISMPFSIAGEDIKPMIQANLDKYINYSIEGQNNGTLVQYSLRTKIDYSDENTYIPIKQNNIEIGLKSIDGKYPNTVNVISKSTQATNGNKQNANFTYDSTAGKIVINTTNQNQDGNIVYSDGKVQDTDEYVIICNYETYTVEENERKVGFEVSVKTLLNREENPEIVSDGNFEVSANANIGDFTTVNYNTDEIYNGYIKSNRINGTNYSTIYKEAEEIVISKKDLQDEIELQDKSINSIYKSTKLLKRNIKNVLGQEGSLIIEDQNGNKLAEINQETEYSDEGTYTVNYEGNIQSIKIKTSKVVNEGIIELKNTKEIQQEEQNSDSVKTETQIIGKKDETQSYINNSEKETKIEDAKTSVDLTFTTDKWTNERQNEITFDMKLNTNGAKYNLYKNPTIKIELPEEVEKVILGDCSLIYGNGLQPNEVKVETNENNRYEIIASLTGEQTQYNENELGLTTEIKIPANIILRKDIVGKTNSIKITTINEYGQAHTEEYNKEVELINFKEDVQAKLNEEIKMNQLFSTVRDGAQNNEVNDSLKLEVAPTKGETVLADGDIVYEGEFIKYNIKVTNTSDQDMENVKVVATIPEGVTYGELEAGYDIDNVKYQYNFENDTREKEIVIGELAAGQCYNGFYEVKVNDLLDGEEQKEIRTRIRTFNGEQEGQKYEGNLTVNNSEYEVYMSAYRYASGNDVWCYKLSLDSDTDREVQVKLHFPEEFEVEYVTWIELATGEPYAKDENITKDDDGGINALLSNKYSYIYQGNMKLKDSDKNSTDGKPVEKTAYAEAIDNGISYKSNEVRIMVSYECIDISMSSDNEGASVNAYDEINYDIEVKNIGGFIQMDSVDYLSITLDDLLPEEVIPESVTYTNWKAITDDVSDDVGIVTGYEKQENVTEEIPSNRLDSDGNRIPNLSLALTIPKGESTILHVKTKARSLTKDTTISNKAKAYGEEIATKETNIVSHTILAEKEEYAHIDDPDNPDEPDNPDNPDTPEDPDSPDTPDDPDSPDTPDNPNIPDNPDNPTSNYSISGMAWIDENRDGQRQENENLVSNLRVLLINMDNTNAVQANTTTNNGYYSFDSLSSGKYIVVYRYDTNQYKLTDYQKTGVNSELNSDANGQEITINGEKTYVGVTDILELEKTINNIDVGLIEVKPCDFKIEKSISKVKVKTAKRTKEYNYDNSSLAKVEIRAKEVEGAVVTIEYKIAITNIGESSGIIGEIIDTLPQGLNYSIDRNNSWIKSNDGKLVNTTLANKIIDAGERIEFNIVVTKNMTANSTGIFTNKAEIVNAQSLENISDKDLSNNSAKADIIISISTGAVLYIALAITTLLILITILALLNKKGIININKLKRPNKISFLIIFLIAMIFSGTIGTKSMASVVQGNVILDTSDSTPKGYDKEWVTSWADVAGKNAWLIFNGTPRVGTTYFVGAHYYWNKTTEGWDYAKYLPGSDKIYGVCMQSERNAAGHVPGDWFDRSDDVIKYNYLQSTNISDAGWKVKEKYNLELKANNGINDGINVNNLDSTYNIYGPFEFTCKSYKTDNNGKNKKDVNNETPTYSIEVKDNTATKKVINGAVICNNKGENLSTLGKNSNSKKTFYVKIPKSNCTNGISQIKLKVSCTFKEDWGKLASFYAIYNPNGNNGGYQTVKIDNPGYVGVDYWQKWDHKFDNSITWTAFNSYVEVEKVDKDDHDKKFAGIGIKLTNQKTGKTYTGTTDKNGKVTFYNIPQQSYTIEETSLPSEFGYRTKAKLTNQDINNGQLVQIVLENQKDTGVLRIEKHDFDSNANMEKIQFKLKSGSKYVRLNNSNKLIGAEAANVITAQDNNVTADKATILETNKNGLVKVANILTGKYTIEEVSVEGRYGYNTNAANIYWSTNGGTTKTQSSTKPIEVTAVRQKSTDTDGITDIYGTTIYIYNAKQTGNLKVLKLDNTTSVPLKGVEFVLKKKDDKGNYNYIRLNNANTFTGKAQITSMTNSTADKATRIVTDKNGEMQLYNILIGDYIIEEVSVGDNYGYDVDNGYIYTYDTAQNKYIPLGNNRSIWVTVGRQKSYATNQNGTNTDRLPNGIYEITLASDSKKSVAEPKNDQGAYTSANNTNMVAAETVNNTAHKFYFEYNSTLKAYKIKNLHSNRVLAVNTSDSNKVQILNDTYNTNDKNQYWTLTKTGNYYYIKSLYNAKLYLNVNNNSMRVTSQNSAPNNNAYKFNPTAAVSTTLKTVKNQKKYIKVSGNVWEDGIFGKDSKFDNVLTERDVRIQGIKVTLKNADGSNATNPDGTKFKNPVYTDANGHYIFEDVIIDELNNYYIEFEYDGEIYTTTKSYNELPEEGTKYTKANAPADTSKAQEVGSQRTTLDNNYTNVKETDKEDKSWVNNSFDVNYTFTKDGKTDAHSTSKNIEKFESQLSSDGKVRNVEQFKDYENYETVNKITATTKETEYNVLGGTTIDEIRKNGITELTDRNCGLVGREKVDLSVSTDLVNVIAEVNGYTNTYMYDKGVTYNQTDEVSAEEAFRLDVKSNGIGYFRKTYASDIVNQGIKMYMTYSITVRNDSNTLAAEVSRLANYYDSRYTRVETGTAIENKESSNMKLTGTVNWSEKEKAEKGYNVEYLTDTIKLAAGEKTTIYVKYELSNDAILSILSGDISLSNIAEINQYTTYYGDNTYYHSGKREGLYASIDKDSAPGNLTIGDNTTYEDDTMASPSLTMQLATNERTIEGNVFEDISEGIDNTTHTGEKRQGNGIYDNTDNNVGNVKVELYTYSENSSSENPAVWSRNYNDEAGLASMWVSRLNRERIDGQNETGIDNRYEVKYEATGTTREEINNNSNVIGYKIPARVNTDNTGHYKIYGIIPGKYILKFTYGNGSVIYKDAEAKGDLKADYYKSTKITSDVIKKAIESKTPGMWYKTTMNDTTRTSDAADDKNSYDVSSTENTRYHSNQYNSSVETKSAYTAPLNIKFEMSNDDNDETSNTSLVLVTNPDGTQQIETLTTYNVTNVDFGITQKAKQEYEVIKEISNVKITLSNGQVLIDGDPRSTDIKYVKFLEGSPFNRANTVDMEIDNEIIIGATLEVEYSIKAINNSELNYLTYDYYYFGKEPSGSKEIEERTEKLKITKTIDYLDNELTFNKTTAEGNINAGTIDENRIKYADKEINTQDYLDNNVINSAKSHSNILVLESDKELKPTETDTWKYKTSKLLSTSDDLSFENYAETIEVVTRSVLSDKNILGNLDSSPASYSSFGGNNETDYFSGSVIITSPTGENRNTIIFAVATAALAIIAGGVWIIKRKVL